MLVFVSIIRYVFSLRITARINRIPFSYSANTIINCHCSIYSYLEIDLRITATRVNRIHFSNSSRFVKYMNSQYVILIRYMFNLRVTYLPRLLTFFNTRFDLKFSFFDIYYSFRSNPFLVSCQIYQLSICYSYILIYKNNN